MKRHNITRTLTGRHIRGLAVFMNIAGRFVMAVLDENNAVAATTERHRIVALPNITKTINEISTIALN